MEGNSRETLFKITYYITACEWIQIFQLFSNIKPQNIFNSYRPEKSLYSGDKIRIEIAFIGKPFHCHNIKHYPLYPLVVVVTMNDSPLNGKLLSRLSA